MAQSFDDAFRGKHAALCDKIDVSHGLLYELLDKDVITRAHKDAIESFRVEQDRVNKLLEVLAKRPDHLIQAFCDSLRSCHQGHIVGLLNTPAQGGVGRNSSSFSNRNSSSFSSSRSNASIPTPSASRPSPASSNSANGASQSMRNPTNGSNGVDSGIYSGPTSSQCASAVQQVKKTLIPDDVRTIDFFQLKQLERIVEGGFGIIHRAQHFSWGTVAYKELKATVINPRDKIARELQREVEARVLRHRNIVAVLGLVFEPSHYGIVLEYATHGGLDDFIAKYEVEWLMKMSLALGVVLGMNYLHTRDEIVIHGDLKIQNVLVADGYVAKICDFGMSKWKQYSTIRTPSRSLRGSVTHIPPENWININQPRTVKYDVYSFGILLWEVLSEKAAFEQASGNTDHIRTSVIHNQRPDLNDIDDKREIPDDTRHLIKEFIAAYWAQDPNDRPTFGDVKDIFSALMSENEVALQLVKSRLDTEVQARS